MSNKHQVVVLKVNAFQEQEVDLSQILSQVPADEIAAVLGSDWAKERGWQALGDGRAHRLTLPGGIKMEIEIDSSDENGPVVKLRRLADTSVTVDELAPEAEKNRLRREAEASLTSTFLSSEDAYNLAFNEIMVEALVDYLPRRAKALGYEIVDTRLSEDEENRIFDLELHMNIDENTIF